MEESLFQVPKGHILELEKDLALSYASGPWSALSTAEIQIWEVK